MTDAMTTMDLLRRVQEGALEPRGLDREERQGCVEHLYGDGLRVSQMADVLKVSTRTVERDLEAIRTRNAVERDDRTTARYVGDLDLRTEQAISRLTQIARDPAQQAQVRVDANRAIIEATRSRFLLLQGVGVLPKAAQEVRADLTHSLRKESPEDLLQELEAIRVIAQTVELPSAVEAAAEAVEVELLDVRRNDAVASEEDHDV